MTQISESMVREVVKEILAKMAAESGSGPTTAQRQPAAQTT